MKALTLWQPWATLIALGHKKVETRGWYTNHRGPIAIHAAKREPHLEDDYDPVSILWARGALSGYQAAALYAAPRGVVVAVADLTACRGITPQVRNEFSQVEQFCGNWESGRYAWILGNVRPLDPPVLARGAQGLWDWNHTDSPLVQDSGAP